jgi:TPP-dependent pyruvate/acetoin dehydrogenase alpha subunit
MPDRVGPVRYLSASGELLCALPDFALDRDILLGLYEAMVLTRRFDEKAARRFRSVRRPL